MDKRQQILRILEIRFYTIKALRGLTRNNINFVVWYENTSDLLKNIYGNNQLVNEFNTIEFSSRKSIANKVELIQQIRESYLKGLQQAEAILKEAIEKYSQFYSIQQIVLDLEERFNFDDIKPIIEVLDLTEREQLEGKIQKSLTELENFQQGSYEKEIFYNNVVKFLNLIQPKVDRFVVLSSVIEIFESSCVKV